MSNESENKRIDLTQFEGRTEGSWLERTGGNMARWIVRGQFLENDANEALICAAPDLIAELKRCYDFIESHGLDEDIEHKMVIDLRECSWECLHQLCVQAGVEDGTKEEMIARLLE